MNDPKDRILSQYKRALKRPAYLRGAVRHEKNVAEWEPDDSTLSEIFLNRFLSRYGAPRSLIKDWFVENNEPYVSSYGLRVDNPQKETAQTGLWWFWTPRAVKTGSDFFIEVRMECRDMGFGYNPRAPFCAALFVDWAPESQSAMLTHGETCGPEGTQRDFRLKIRAPDVPGVYRLRLAFRYDANPANTFYGSKNTTGPYSEIALYVLNDEDWNYWLSRFGKPLASLSEARISKQNEETFAGGEPKKTPVPRAPAEIIVSSVNPPEKPVSLDGFGSLVVINLLDEELGLNWEDYVKEGFTIRQKENLQPGRSRRIQRLPFGKHKFILYAKPFGRVEKTFRLDNDKNVVTWNVTPEFFE